MPNAAVVALYAGWVVLGLAASGVLFVRAHRALGARGGDEAELLGPLLGVNVLFGVAGGSVLYHLGRGHLLAFTYPDRDVSLWWTLLVFAGLHLAAVVTVILAATGGGVLARTRRGLRD